MQISVIMPVYNAAEFVQEAVESALAQPEVAEVILVEDASPDNSLAACERLAAEFEQVRLYRHADGGNHGAAVSRNVAIQKSTCPYIAFLDADDYYLPGRFATARQILEENPDIDGVYEAMGCHFQNELAREQWINARGHNFLTTLSQSVPPEQLFEALVSGGFGYFSGNGLVVKRAAFDRAGSFDQSVYLHEDTAMWIKLAATARLAAGCLDKPVVMRRVHAQNRIIASRSEIESNRLLRRLWEATWMWGRTNLPDSRQQLVLNAYLRLVLKPCRQQPANFRRAWCSLKILIVLLFHHPAMSRQRVFWRIFFRQFPTKAVLSQQREPLE